tara:strand:- start:1694 stop:2221 length:528 start_codon:yes stop_codon:yes gene_type:complete
MWFNLLKQPQLGMGKVGLVDLSNVPEEQDDKCRRKLIEIYEFWKDYEQNYNNNKGSRYHHRIKKKFVIKLEDLNSVPEEICCEFLGELASFATTEKLENDYQRSFKSSGRPYNSSLTTKFWGNKSELYLGWLSKGRKAGWLIKIWSTAVSDDDIPLLKTQMEDMLNYLKKQTKGF